MAPNTTISSPSSGEQPCMLALYLRTISQVPRHYRLPVVRRRRINHALAIAGPPSHTYTLFWQVRRRRGARWPAASHLVQAIRGGRDLRLPTEAGERARAYVHAHMYHFDVVPCSTLPYPAPFGGDGQDAGRHDEEMARTEARRARGRQRCQGVCLHACAEPACRRGLQPAAAARHATEPALLTPPPPSSRVE